MTTHQVELPPIVGPDRRTETTFARRRASLIVRIVTTACVLLAALEHATAQSADVVVYGGTASGVIASVAAAREGATVTLVEPSRHLGGMVSSGLGWTDYGREETVGGYTREFFRRVGKHYDRPDVEWHFEPHVAERVFNEMIEEAGVQVEFGQRLLEGDAVRVEDGRIVSIRCESGKEYQAATFIDASYEGDLMARAGVSFHAGREARDEFDEPSAGVRKLFLSGMPGAAVDEQGVLPLVHTGKPGAPGSGDAKIQSYNFRLCLTNVPGNRLPIEKPRAYDPRDYVLMARLLANMPDPELDKILNIERLPNGKSDVNNYGLLSTNLVNGNWGYPNGTYAEREAIWQRHKDYDQGLIWFLQNDPRVPENIRREIAPWGLAKDEFTDSGHWPRQMYIREGRRMRGAHVLTERDLRSDNEKPDSIAMGSYFMDCHPVQRGLAENGDYYTEGHIGGQSRVFPYEIPYRSLTPRREQCRNLLVTFCVSVTHVAWTSVRMEPVLMMMGHSAGVAAAMAAKEQAAVQDISVDALRGRLAEKKQVLRWKIPAALRPTTMPGVVVDDDQAQLTGRWSRSNKSNLLVGLTFRWASGNPPTRVARYVPELPADGRYDVRMYYPPDANRASNVRVTVRHADGETFVRIDEKKDPSAEGLSLGVFKFAGDGKEWVEISTEGAEGMVTIDAVQWVPTRACSLGLRRDRAFVAHPAARRRRDSLVAARWSRRAPHRT